MCAILPILCGSFARSLSAAASPRTTTACKRFLEALGELREREGDRLFWILGVDMAHMGARYQRPFTACAGQGVMNEVDARDRARIARIDARRRRRLLGLVRENRDDLKWCGSSPFYTFLKTAPEGPRRTAALRAVEHRRAKRGQLRRHGVFEASYHWRGHSCLPSDSRDAAAAQRASDSGPRNGA